MFKRIQSYFQLFKRSMKEEHQDFTTGPIADAVILLAVPMILELSLESVFAVVDMYFVSGLGANAIATVGLTEAVVTLVYSVAIGLSAGATAIVARRVGEKNLPEAGNTAAQSIFLTTLISLPISLLGILYAKEMLQLMGASPEVASEGAIFGQILIGGNLVILLLFLINGIFRGAGDATMAMKSLWIASGTNILLCPIFVHTWGLQGAAIATVIGRTAGVSYQCYHLFWGRSLLRLRLPQFKIDPQQIRSIVKISWPATLQFLIGSGSWIVMTKMVADSGGTPASAGYQIAFRNFAFFILPAWGLSNAAATLVGQNLGAKNSERAELSVFKTMKYSAFLMALVTLFLLVAAPGLVGLFTTDPIVFKHGVTALRIIASGFIFYGLAMVLSQALNGAGDTKAPTRLNIICFWIFQIPLAYTLIHFLDMGPAGAMAAVPISQALFAYLSWWYFKKGYWKNKEV